MAASTEVAGGRAFPRLHWGAVIAGVLLALAAHVVLGLIGATLGFAAQPAGSRAVGVAAAIWALVTPFVATLCGAWLACRMADAYDSMSGYLHGVLVWCIGLIAGAIFLTGTMASGALSAGTAASGNLGAAQRTLRGEPATRPGSAQARAEDAAKGAAVAAGGGALAAIAGLLGGVVGAGISLAGRGGRTRRWGGTFRREETRAGMAHATDRGFGTTYGGPEAPRMPGTTTGVPPEGEVPPGDPYHH
jgi:hypothetical protein